MAKNSSTALKKRIVINYPFHSNPGREIFAMPPRWDVPNGPVFDAIELAPVAVYEDGECEPYESLTDIPKSNVREVLWSIYGHTPGEGVDCIGDFTTREHALDIVRRLLGDLRPYERPQRKRPQHR